MPRNTTHTPPQPCDKCQRMPSAERVSAMQAIAVADLREIAANPDYPAWLGASLGALIDRIEINTQLLLETQQSIEADCLTFRNLIRTNSGKDRL